MYHKTTGVYHGKDEMLYYDSDNELWLWTYGGNNVITENVGHPITLRYDTGGSWSTPLTPIGFVLNGQDIYSTTIDSVTYYLWYATSDWEGMESRWVLSTYIGYGTAEYQDVDDGNEWKGDYWWSGTDINDITATKLSPAKLEKRGAGKESSNNKKDYYIAAGQMEGWTKSGTEVAGIYEEIPDSSVTGHKWVGWKILNDSKSATYTHADDVLTVTCTDHGLSSGATVYIEFASSPPDSDYMEVVSATDDNIFTISLSGSSASGSCTVGYDFIQDNELTNSKESYTGSRSIWWSPTLGKYVISDTLGEYDPLVGYWTCSTLEGTYTRTFSQPDPVPEPPNVPPEPTTYTIAHREYRICKNMVDVDMETIYMGQVALWL